MSFSYKSSVSPSVLSKSSSVTCATSKISFSSPVPSSLFFSSSYPSSFSTKLVRFRLPPLSPVCLRLLVESASLDCPFFCTPDPTQWLCRYVHTSPSPGLVRFSYTSWTCSFLVSFPRVSSIFRYFRSPSLPYLSFFKGVSISWGIQLIHLLTWNFRSCCEIDFSPKSDDF